MKTADSEITFGWEDDPATSDDPMVTWELERLLIDAMLGVH
jgi:hypothetical protein